MCKASTGRGAREGLWAEPFCVCIGAKDQDISTARTKGLASSTYPDTRSSVLLERACLYILWVLRSHGSAQRAHGARFSTAHSAFSRRRSALPDTHDPVKDALELVELEVR